MPKLTARFEVHQQCESVKRCGWMVLSHVPALRCLAEMARMKLESPVIVLDEATLKVEGCTHSYQDTHSLIIEHTLPVTCRKPAAPKGSNSLPHSGNVCTVWWAIGMKS